MSEHTCNRCGYETNCAHGSWPDRHPAAAVTAGLFGLVWMSMMLSVYPVAAVTLVVLSGVGGAVYKTSQDRRRRAALAARADYEHQAAMAAPVQAVRPLPIRQTHSLPWRLIHLLRTEPLRVQGNSLRP